ncbi:MAG: FecR domain-containing protein [Aestuariivirga sp.]|nr:FecR domain-containing protein [Aestuariivirga sp.]
MTRFSRYLIAALTLPLLLAPGAFAAEQIGKALAITVTVSGDNGILRASSPIHRDERIRASNSGQGQFEFRDGTKLAVGPNSSLVLDRSIFAGDSSFQTLTLKATRGTFRWVSGNSKSSAYKVNTPFGTLGVRGTVVDIYLGSSSAAVVILEGQATFCGNDGTCKRLERGCDIVRANRKGLLDVETDPKTAVSGVRNEVSFPFLMGTRKLSKPFQVGGGRCGLSASVRAFDQKKGGDGVKSDPEPPSRGNPDGPQD